jgi:hypothetical protein
MLINKVQSYTEQVDVAVTLQSRIIELPSSNPDRETDYCDWHDLWFSSVPSGECLKNTPKLATAMHFHILSNLSFINHSTVWRYVIYILTASLNKSRISFIYLV